MWEFLPAKIRLRGTPRLADQSSRQLRADYERFRDGLPQPLESYILRTYGIDLTSTYAGLKVKNPFGKASGQLSLARHQVEKDSEGGLGFVVLKTVIAQDQMGEQTMWEWAIPETRMMVEHMRGRSGVEGWTVTWKGRGWYDTFGAYLELFDEALSVGRSMDMLVVPSVKYHLPKPEEEFWKDEEYLFTTRRLAEVWGRYHGSEPMPLEKDFSPTLAGSERAAQQVKILEWLRKVPGFVHRAAPGKVCVGLKIFNTLFDDAFQVHMLETVQAEPVGEERADFLVYANRLFDPEKAFEGTEGVAYGGPDLSDRNLAVLERFLAAQSEAPERRELIPLSATGDIHSGRIAAEYLLRGASSFQMHTIFQWPDSEFAMRSGNKTQKALDYLLFHPEEGFLAWVLDLSRRLGWSKATRVSDMSAWCGANWNKVIDLLREDHWTFISAS